LSLFQSLRQFIKLLVSLEAINHGAWNIEHGTQLLHLPLKIIKLTLFHVSCFMFHAKIRGFTLVELLIVLAIIAVVGALAIPFIQTFQVSSDLYTYADTITKTLRRAQRQAVTGQNEASWGVYFDNGNKTFILFKGDDYASRDQNYDQQNDYPPVFSISDDFGSEVYFSVYSGSPSAVGTVTMTSGNNESKTISIDDYGKIEISN